MQLTKSHRAADLAELALSELEAIVSDPWSGGQRSERDIEMHVELRLNEALAMVHRIGFIIDYETSGHRANSFGPWWKTAEEDPLFDDVKRIRNLEFKRGERGLPGTTVIFQDNEDEPAGTPDDPKVVLRSNPFGVIDLLRRYLSWCQSVLIPGAEQRTL